MTVEEKLLSVQDLLIPLAHRQDYLEIIRRIWQAKSATQASNDFKKNPLLNLHSHDQTPMRNHKSINQWAKRAQVLYSVKTDFGNSKEVFNTIVKFIEQFGNVPN